MLPLLEGTPMLACLMHAWERRRVRVFRVFLNSRVHFVWMCTLFRGGRRRLRDSVRRVCLCVCACVCLCMCHGCACLVGGRCSQILFVTGLGRAVV